MLDCFWLRGYQGSQTIMQASQSRESRGAAGAVGDVPICEPMREARESVVTGGGQQRFHEEARMNGRRSVHIGFR